MTDVLLPQGINAIFDSFMARGETEMACAVAMELIEQPEVWKFTDAMITHPGIPI